MRINPDGFQNSSEKQFKIYNIRSNELLRLDATAEELNFIVVSILKGKYLKEKEKTLDEFLFDCQESINKL
jgi:hypothetical protein